MVGASRHSFSSFWVFRLSLFIVQAHPISVTLIDMSNVSFVFSSFSIFERFIKKGYSFVTFSPLDELEWFQSVFFLPRQSSTNGIPRRSSDSDGKMHTVAVSITDCRLVWRWQMADGGWRICQLFINNDKSIIMSVVHF